MTQQREICCRTQSGYLTDAGLVLVRFVDAGGAVSNYQWVATAATVFFLTLAVFSFSRARKSGSYGNTVGLNVTGTLCALAAIMFGILLKRAF